MSDFKPVCTSCGSVMTPAFTEQGNPGFDLRIFKCPKCHRLQQYVIDGSEIYRCQPDALT
jgi:DNA-directed RNA polymerase subunit M/transcription elongation factor TFIIS